METFPTRLRKIKDERAIELKISDVHLHISCTDTILYFSYAHTYCKYCQSTDYQGHISYACCIQYQV